MNKKICSFFGHREVTHEIEDMLITQIRYAITYYGVEIFYIGNNGEFDSITRRVLRKIKDEHKKIEIYVALAYFPTHGLDVPSYCDGSIFFEGLEIAHKKAAITKRNRLMVEASDVLICYINRNHGGAYQAMKYACKLEKPILNCGTHMEE